MQRPGQARCCPLLLICAMMLAALCLRLAYHVRRAAAPAPELLESRPRGAAALDDPRGRQQVPPRADPPRSEPTREAAAQPTREAAAQPTREAAAQPNPAPAPAAVASGRRKRRGGRGWACPQLHGLRGCVPGTGPRDTHLRMSDPSWSTRSVPGLANVTGCSGGSGPAIPDDPVSAYIWRLQNPPDCTKARLLLYTPWQHGFGSEIHAAGGILHHAVASGRTLVPLGTWVFAAAACPAESLCCYAAVGRCGAAHFAPAEVHEWDPKHDAAPGGGPRVVRVGKPHYANMTAVFPQELRAVPAAVRPEAERRGGWLWWRVALTAALTRLLGPLRDYVEQRLAAAGLRSAERCVALHVRRADKVKTEAAAHAVAEYMPYVRRALRRHNATTVYLSSDSAGALREAAALTERGDARFVWTTGHHRLFGDVVRPTQLWYLSRGLLPGDTEAMVAWVNAFGLARCEAFVGTLSSNWGRFAVELFMARKGTAAVDYVSLDHPHVLGGEEPPRNWELAAQKNATLPPI
eukprot:TRINITY_DN22690_c0_g1_i1.p1 TRINITY_DN22690_c0_g1~~TRINITY_DN22690_c0_g1_i1.p1  ORF type:complete len:521 (+),score=147.75 TRINITY_DN22690_c0_g1_i1:77-1639(+)